MPIITKKNNDEGFQIASAGSHEAVCCAVWDLGRQIKVWNNQEKIMNQIIIAWEITETIQDPKSKVFGKRLVISERYTNSLNDKANLRKDLESWRGRGFSEQELEGFDLEKLVGVDCLLSIVHNKKGDKTYANVSAVMRAMKGKVKMIIENPKDFCPDWVKDIQAKAIPENEPEEKSPDIDVSNFEKGDESDLDDEVPF